MYKFYSLIFENESCRCEAGTWWELDFENDPTKGTDGNLWKLRNNETFDTSELENGRWKSMSTLDTAPEFDFNQSTSIHLKFRNTTLGGKGAVLWMNVDYTESSHAVLYASLTLQENNTQTLSIFGKNDSETIKIIDYTDLSTDFINLWVSLDIETNKISVWLEDKFMGEYKYPIRNTLSENKFISIFGWGSEAEFDYIRIESCADGVSHPTKITCENTQHHPEEGECVGNLKMVACLDKTPENGSTIDSQEEIIWESGRWSTSPQCDFTCNEGYQKKDNNCVKKGGTPLVMATEDDITGYPFKNIEPAVDWPAQGGKARIIGDNETIIIENMIFDGNSPKGGFLYVRGTKNVKTNHLIIRNCAFINTNRKAITTYQVGNVTIEGNYFDNVNSALSVTATYNNLVIRKNKFSRTGQELGFLSYPTVSKKIRTNITTVHRYYGTSFIFEDNLYDNSMDMRFYNPDQTRKNLTRRQISAITYMDDNVNFGQVKPRNGTKAYIKNNIGHATALGSKYITMRHTKYDQVTPSYGTGDSAI